ncbi:MAG: FG-GAP repeat domain-containing protein, partial [Vicinamibacterales bacterium]
MLFALTAVTSHAQIAPSPEPFVVGQGTFGGGGGWLAYRGDRPDFEPRTWRQLPWPAYNVTGGAVHPAMGDVDGDGRDEIVLGVDTGGGGWMAVLDDREHDNALLAWLQVPFPTYNATNGAVFPAVGDLDGDGRAEIVAGLGRAGGGRFAIFDDAATGFSFLRSQQVQWPVYTEGADGRTHVAVGDLTGDGSSEIIVGLGPGSGGWIEIFKDASGGFGHHGWLQVAWPAYNALNGTVYPAAGDLDGDGRAEVVAGLGAGANGWVEVIDGRAPYGHLAWKQVAWTDYNARSGETHPAVGNIDSDPGAEVIVGLAEYSGDGGWFAILDDLDAGLGHLAWRNL